ncbi:MAG: hypothetical protein ACJ790_20500 [Myxococcaceae bacterium]
MSRYRFEWYLRPGKQLSDERKERLQSELCELGALCLHPLPDYQVFAKKKDALDDKALVIARRADGKMAAFCSAVLLEIEGVGEVLHLGLLCVHPEDRRGGLTHRLSKRLTLRYALHRRFRRFWITNVACVLSSLGTFARNTATPHPAPGSQPGETTWKIARAFDRDHREKAYVQPGATFDPDSFVFRRSGKGTAFQKSAEDKQFFHRDPQLNDFFKPMLNFEDGDEMLQVGSLGLSDFVKNALG